MKLLSRVRLFTTPWTAAHQAPLPMGFSRQEDWSVNTRPQFLPADHNQKRFDSHCHWYHPAYQITSREKKILQILSAPPRAEVGTGFTSFYNDCSIFFSHLSEHFRKNKIFLKKIKYLSKICKKTNLEYYKESN